ncbi:MAG: DNA-3-methyladenine glycosylase I [Candidatus Gastranaerophilales bacterium]|nr:DNA-3-methyladenine glycosylase I [Candidatus Gastranaerophilales bacterium]
MSYCNWGNTSKINIKYHDEEWGVPVFDDRKQFEYLMLEVMQCGLNWNMIINKREIFRSCFDNFEVDKIAEYTEKDIERILNFEGMIKSRRKIEAVIHNAKSFIKIREEFGSFCNYFWKFSDGKTILYDKHELGYIPVSNGLSDKISKDLKKRGFKFLGTITMYSHMQAAGMINDHDKNCIRYKYINSNYPTVNKRRYLEKNVTYFG